MGVSKKHIEKLMAEATITDMMVGAKTTMVVAVFKSGYETTVTSSCVIPEEYDHELGKSICMKRIEDKLWELEGYRYQCAIAGMEAYNG